jgi:hypothetical protein
MPKCKCGKDATIVAFNTPIYCRECFWDSEYAACDSCGAVVRAENTYMFQAKVTARRACEVCALNYDLHLTSKR